MNGLKRGRFLLVALALALGAAVVIPTLVAQPAEDGQTQPARDWPLVGGDWTNRRYSSLTEINRTTLSSLGVVWTRTFDDGASSRATPVVKDGVMFLTAGARVYAIEGRSGRTVWTWRSDQDVKAPDVSDTSGLVAALNIGGLALPSPPGVALGEGLVFVGLMDGRVAALRQIDGAQVWIQQTGTTPPQRGQSVSGPPTYARGIVFSGLANGDWALRGRVVALDAKTGRELWHVLTVPGPGEPGHETWAQDNEVWKQGGGGVWQVGAIDADVGLVFFGTGNTVPVTGGEIRAGDNLFTNSVLALDMRTGKLRWHYQVIRHDLWDTDIPIPVLLYDTEVGGRSRRALAVMRPDGYLFLLDRETGRPLGQIEERPVAQDRRLKTAATQPFPVGADRIVGECETWRSKVPAPFTLDCRGFAPPSWDRHDVLIPAVSVRVTPMSYSPQTGYIYAQGNAALARPRRISEDPWFWGSAGGDLSLLGIRSTTVLAAIDSRTNKIAWKKELGGPAASSGSGPLTTAAGLLFRADADGHMQAYDAKTGDRLWQFQTGVAGGRGPAAIYQVDGRQHVAVALGRSIWAFALGGSTEPRPAPRSIADGEAQGTTELTAEIEATTLVTPCCVQGGRRWAVDEYAFKPQRATVVAGTPLPFMNNGRLAHTFVARDGSWTTGTLQPGQETAVTFDQPGTFLYTCKEHPWSIGQIVVRERATGVGDASRPVTRDAATTGARNGTAEGAFTADQANRGRATFGAQCGACHGEALAGTERAPALAGGPFLQRWSGRSVGELFETISTTMPSDRPGSIDQSSVVDIVAFLLQANGFVAGRRSLSHDAGLLGGISIRRE